jgi:preprotein translocase subunit SecG
MLQIVLSTSIVIIILLQCPGSLGLFNNYNLANLYLNSQSKSNFIILQFTLLQVSFFIIVLFIQHWLLANGIF